MTIQQVVFEEKVRDLYMQLHYYGHVNVEDGVWSIFHEPDIPLINHWPSPQRLMETWDLFRKFAHDISEDEFFTKVSAGTIPDGVELNRRQRVLASDIQQLHIQARFLWDFFCSMEEFFAYEVWLAEHGFFRSPRHGDIYDTAA